jgi:hypothetical protein
MKEHTDGGMYPLFNEIIYLYMYCATSRKVAGSIPDGVIGIFL